MNSRTDAVKPRAMRERKATQYFTEGSGHAVIFSLAIVLALATASECQSMLHLPSLVYGLALWGWWACVASVLWKIGQRRPSLWSLTPKGVVLHALAASALGFVHILLLRNLGSAYLVPRFTREMWNHMLNPNRFGMELLLYGFILGIGGFLQFQIRAQREAMRTLELEKQLSAAHLRALQMQLEPHFLFNTLNAITTLVELGRQKPAAEMLGHLNALLKSTLARTTPEKICLSQELEFAENYLAIEQVRFADRLRVRFEVQPDALNGLVPCFLLQPIVENAIKHGIAHCENEGRVEVSVMREGDFLQLLVRDSGSGQPAKAQNGHGIGLTNTRERLAHFYAADYSMVTRPLETSGFEVVIIIPYERAEQGAEKAAAFPREIQEAVTVAGADAIPDSRSAPAFVFRTL
ncbi:MAG: sensor histidine kinase [Acidobacteriaceae bacterium]